MTIIGKIFAFLCLISLAFGAFCGKMYEVSAAALEGAGRAVELSIGMCGTMALWSGVMRVLERAGAIGVLSRLISPLLGLLFPDAYAKKNGLDEISATLAANLLGIGNAATPLALAAMQRLDENRGADKQSASDDMVTFAVMNTAPFTLFPTTLVALRASAGSREVFSVIPAVWLCSLAGCVFGALLCRISSRIFGQKGGVGDKKSFLIYKRKIKHI